MFATSGSGVCLPLLLRGLPSTRVLRRPPNYSRTILASDDLSERDSSSSLRSSCLVNVLRINLWRLFADFSRIDDEFERIRVLIPFHQLQIDEPLSALERIAVGKLCFCGFDQIRCHLIFPICGKTVRGCDNLHLGESQIVNE